MDLRGVEAVGGSEVAGVECLHLREARLAQPLPDGRFVTRAQLVAQDFLQIVLVRPVRIAPDAFKATGQASDDDSVDVSWRPSFDTQSSDNAPARRPSAR
mgnify:CR=1 FL=1